MPAGVQVTKSTGGARMKKRIALAIIIFSLVLTGCAQQQIYRSSPPIKIVGNDIYEVTLHPRKAEGYDYYNSFLFVLTNKTDQDLILNWSETYYLRNGKRHGNFGWEGLTFAELKKIQEQPEITIAAGQTDRAVIFPLRLIGWREEGVRMKADSVEAGFTLTPLPEGENGISIAVLKDGKLIRERVLVEITRE